MSSLALTLPRRNPRAFLLSGAIIWFAQHRSPEPFSHVLAGALPLENGTHLPDALQFFFYDTPKVLLPLAGIVFELVILRKVLKPGLIATFVGVASMGIMLAGYVFNAVV